MYKNNNNLGSRIITGRASDTDIGIGIGVGTNIGIGKQYDP